MHTCCYHMTKEMYNGLATESDRPQKKAYLHRSQYDPKVLDILNNDFDLLKKVEKIIIV